MAYSRWRIAEKVLAVPRSLDEVTRGLMIEAVDGNPRTNPLVRVASSAADDMIRDAGELGLTLVVRTRLAAGLYNLPRVPSKLDGLLQG